jgi:hypothetical protein
VRLDDFDYEPFTKQLTEATSATTTPSTTNSDNVNAWNGVDSSSLLRLINIALDFLDGDTQPVAPVINTQPSLSPLSLPY